MSSTPAQRAEWGEQLRDLGKLIQGIGEAMVDQDDIMGIISGEGIANHMAALPRHIRETFTEYLSEEAALGYQADQRYLELQP